MTDLNAPPPSTLVVLLMPELIAGTDDVAALHQALKCPGQPVRVLIRVANPDQFWFAETFARIAPDTELLLAHGVPEPSGTVVFARLPQGGGPNEENTKWHGLLRLQRDALPA